MLANPCDATLKAGMHGESEGYMATIKDTFSNNAGASAGYMLWAPRYHNRGWAGGEIVERQNLWAWATNNSFAKPHNDPVTGPATVFGQASSFNNSLLDQTTAALPDPAAPMLGQDLIADARLLSACMKVTYNGRLDRSSGQLAFIENLPIATLIGEPDHPNSPISVDELFRMSTSVQRFGVDTAEVVHRPDMAVASLFHDQTDSAVDGTVGSRSRLGESARITQPHLFGFAWRSLDLSGNGADITFEITKNIEWRPSALSNFVSTVPRSVGAGNNDNLTKAMAYLDRTNPGWTRRIIDSAGSMAGQVVRMAYQGMAPRVAAYGMRAILG